MGRAGMSDDAFLDDDPVVDWSLSNQTEEPSEWALNNQTKGIVMKDENGDIVNIEREHAKFAEKVRLSMIPEICGFDGCTEEVKPEAIVEGIFGDDETKIKFQVKICATHYQRVMTQDDLAYLSITPVEE
jgi:hypothetical protein